MGVVGGLAEHVVPGYFGGRAGKELGEKQGEKITGLDLGSGVWIAPFTASYVPDGEHAGGIVWHVHADDERLCGGAVLFVTDPERPNRPVWTVESWDPLTISPSVLARSGPGGAECLHGFIRNGRWEGC